MLGSVTNDGRLEELVAVGINAKGAIVFSREEWIRVAEKYRITDTKAYADKNISRNRGVLDRAFELGQKMAD